MLPRLEASVRTEITTQLTNLGWVVDESDSRNNVTQERPKTKEQRDSIKKYHKSSHPKLPDFVLYQSRTNTPIAVIEAKRPGESLEKALKQAERYAIPLKAPLIFAYNNTFVATRYLNNRRALKIDGEEVRQFIDEATALRFYHEGPEILSAPGIVQPSRQDLIKKFKTASDLLREAGIQAGPSRFSAFSDLLFLKLIDEKCQLEKHRGKEPTLPSYLRWEHFSKMSPNDMHSYVEETVWPKMNKKYGDVFGLSLPIKNKNLFSEIIHLLNDLNLTTADSDVKGDAFEFFLKNAYQGIKLKDLGEYFTPRNIVRMMVSMVDPKIGETIYDPFCGTGGFLIEAFRYLSLRVESTQEEILKLLKNKTVYGAEITDTARVAKMNMILFGDGHNNVIQHDSFANLSPNRYDIIVTNPPYSLRTNHINEYPIPTNNADLIAVQHCFESLKNTGKSRAAILVKEDFLVNEGEVGKVRDYIFNSAKNVSIVSLPRNIFQPYTPTKTSIVYLEKGIDCSGVHFFVVKNVGHTLNTRPKTIPENDIPYILDGFLNNTTKNIEKNIIATSVARSKIKKSSNSLWAFDYLDVLPITKRETIPLADIIESCDNKIVPSEQPENLYTLLTVSKMGAMLSGGIYKDQEMLGGDINGERHIVSSFDFVYNPHRINLGSIGIVPSYLDGGLVSGAYVVFRIKKSYKIPAYYVLSFLRSKAGIDIISAYDSRHGAVRANLTYEQICRIRLPQPTEEEKKEYQSIQKEADESLTKIYKKESKLKASMNETTSSIISKPKTY